MDQVADFHQPITITGKHHVLDTEDWYAIQETLYFLSVPGMRDSIKDGMLQTVETWAKKLNW